VICFVVLVGLCDKDKKVSDDGKDGKKDEKPAQKKLAQCT
jgi:hypothetical protein